MYFSAGMSQALDPEHRNLEFPPEAPQPRLSFMASAAPAAPGAERTTMDQSPLTRQVPPDIFEPKIVQLYSRVFKVGFC